MNRNDTKINTKGKSGTFLKKIQKFLHSARTNIKNNFDVNYIKIFVIRGKILPLETNFDVIKAKIALIGLTSNINPILM